MLVYVIILRYFMYLTKLQ